MQDGRAVSRTRSVEEDTPVTGRAECGWSPPARHDESRVNELSWSWIALELSVPPIVALLSALPFWRTGQMVLGNLAGTAVIFGSAIALILREHVALDRLVREAFDNGVPSWPNPSAFTRYAIYASIALIEVFGVFMLSLWIEERGRRRDYAPEWRR